MILLSCGRMLSQTQTDKGIHPKPKTCIQHPLLWLDRLQLLGRKRPKKAPPVCASFRLLPRLDHWCGGTENGEQTTVLSELPIEWVRSHAEGCWIRGFAFTANRTNSEKSVSHPRYNVNASITSWLSLSKRRRLRRFREPP